MIDILNDLPARKDALDFQPYVETIAGIVFSESVSTPLTIGVFGSWGSAKTSLMQMVREKLPPGYVVAWFDAWRYERETTLWRALLLQVLSALKLSVQDRKADESDKPHEAEGVKELQEAEDSASAEAESEQAKEADPQ